MNEIPQSVIEIARLAERLYAESADGESVPTMIAKAITNERVRCARVALAAVMEPSEDEEAGGYEWASRTASNCNAGQIAVGIMKGIEA